MIKQLPATDRKIEILIYGRLRIDKVKYKYHSGNLSICFGQKAKCKTRVQSFDGNPSQTGSPCSIFQPRDFNFALIPAC